jgi:uncharacterized RDD family membrane protein YckC
LSRRPAGEPGSEPGAPRPNASLARRLASLAYEALLLAAVILFVGFLTIPLATPEPGRPGVPVIPVAPARLLSACLVALGAGAYFCWSWTGGRRTLPMQTWGLRIERRDGAPVETKTAVARFLTAWIGPAAALLAWIALLPHGLGAHAAWLVALNYLWALVDPNRQFLHDRLAGTRITRVHRGPG